MENSTYSDYYRGKTLILKVSGAELVSPEFREGIQQIQELTRAGIKFIIVFGGQKQIDEKWKEKHPDTPRPKLDGIGITSDEVLTDAVIPAYFINRAIFDLHFPLSVLRPYMLEVEPKNPETLGYVGTVNDIQGIREQDPVNVIGFLGGDLPQPLNINADEIIKAVIRVHSEIEGVLMATPTAGVLNKKGELVSKLNRKEVMRILANEHPDITAEGGMRKKLEEVAGLMFLTKRVVMLRGNRIKKELLERDGAGTLFQLRD